MLTINYINVTVRRKVIVTCKGNFGVLLGDTIASKNEITEN